MAHAENRKKHYKHARGESTQGFFSPLCGLTIPLLKVWKWKCTIQKSTFFLFIYFFFLTSLEVFPELIAISTQKRTACTADFATTTWINLPYKTFPISNLIAFPPTGLFTLISQLSITPYILWYYRLLRLHDYFQRVCCSRAPLILCAPPELICYLIPPRFSFRCSFTYCHRLPPFLPLTFPNCNSCNYQRIKSYQHAALTNNRKKTRWKGMDPAEPERCGCYPCEWITSFNISDLQCLLT